MTAERVRRAGAVILLGAALAGAAPFGEASANDFQPWPVKNRLQGKIEDGKAEKSEDVSGIACSPGPDFPRLCLLADDETQGAQIVILSDGLLVAGDFIPLIQDSYDGAPLELDAEGVGYADGYFYVIGAHARGRHDKDQAKETLNEAKAAATRRVFRIAFSADDVDLGTGKLERKPQVTQSAALATLLQKDAVLAPFFNQPLAHNGITIEGVAVRGDTLYAAFRGPLIGDGNAVIASAPLSAVFEGQPGALKIDRLDLGKDSIHQPRGIRDLVVEGDGFLLIAGPEADAGKKRISAPGDYAIYAWDGKAATKVLDLPSTGTAKLEALLPLSRNGATLRALLMFDGAKEGSPIPVEISLP